METNLKYCYGYDPDLLYRNLSQVMNCGMRPKGGGWYRTIPCNDAQMVFNEIFAQREIFLWIERELASDLLPEELNDDGIIQGTINSRN